MNFLEKNMRIKVVVDSSGRRSNISEYPMVALREAIVNALVHRDYSIYTEKSYIRVFKYKDRIEIESPGTLYGRNRIEQLGTDTMLEVRNSTIVQILENQKSILENRHSGIPTMKSEMLKNDLPEPEFINQRGSFKVIFYNGEGKSDTVEGKSDTVEGKSD
ncbi:MAG: DNA helicase, partial [Fusobacterium necrophorum]|nr:DNA helicase [Fusobacterium necrophorum]